MQYPSDWIGGKHKGKIVEKKSLSKFIAEINVPSDSKNENCKEFSYLNKDKNKVKNEATKWLWLQANKYNLLVNKYRFIDKENIEVDAQGTSFFVNKRHLVKIEKYTIGTKIKKDKKCDRTYIVYSYGKNDSENGKKGRDNLVKLLFDHKIIKYIDGNTLNLRDENIENFGEIPFEHINDEKDYTVDHYEIINPKYKISNISPSLLYPNNKWIFGKFDDVGTCFIKKGDEEHYTIVVHSALTNKSHTKTIRISDFINVENAKVEANKIKYDMSYKLGVVKNMINIISDETMKVICKDKNNVDYFMICDIVLLPLIQKMNISLRNDKNFLGCITKINEVNRAFHSVIMPYYQVKHINGNPLDFRFINICLSNNFENNKINTLSLIIDKDTNEKYYFVKVKSGGITQTKKFYLKDFGNNESMTKEIAEVFKNNIFEVNINTSEIEFTGYETLEDLIFLYNQVDKIKKELNDNIIFDATKYLKNIDLFDKEKKSIYEKYLATELWRLKNLDNKILIVNSQIEQIANGQKIRKTVFIKNVSPFDTKYEIYKLNDCKVKYTDVNNDSTEENINDDVENVPIEEKPKKVVKVKKDDSDSDIENKKIVDANSHNYKDEDIECDIPKDKDKYYYDAIKKIVEQKGGSVVSDTYVKAKVNMTFKCTEGHIFKATPNNIKLGKWCPTCNIKQNELYMSEIINYIFPDNEFKKIRPNWLKNNEGNNLELDLYCQELNLAFEYNGPQHYVFVKHFHKTEENLKKRQQDDLIKYELCKKNNIVLIIIPYTVSSNEMYDFVINELQKHKIKFSKPEKPIDISQIKMDNKQMKKVSDIVKEKGGAIELGTYVTRSSRIIIKCEKGHTWETNMGKILSGSLCHTCGLEVTDETKGKISTTLTNFYKTEKGKETKKKSFEKRSITMKDIVDNMTEKQCSKCKATKPVSEFGKRGGKYLGYQSYCKSCINDTKKESKNKKKIDKENKEK